MSEKRQWIAKLRGLGWTTLKNMIRAYTLNSLSSVLVCVIKMLAICRILNPHVVEIRCHISPCGVLKIHYRNCVYLRGQFNRNSQNSSIWIM